MLKPKKADPATTTVVVLFCGSVTLLSLFEQFNELTGVVAAFVAAWWVVNLEEKHSTSLSASLSASRSSPGGRDGQEPDATPTQHP